MKSVPAVRDAIRSAHNVTAVPRLTAEWNMNRHYDVVADNIAQEEDYAYDNELFPIESIIEGNRPTKGIAKARVGQALVSPGYTTQPDVRFYLVSKDDAYKYWTSPVPTNASGVFRVYNAAFAAEYEATNTSAPDGFTVVRPFIRYHTTVRVNKIIIKTENSWASLKDFDVSVLDHSTGRWTAISNTVAKAGFNLATGQITLWWTGSGWSATRPLGNLVMTEIGGIMLSVYSLGPGRDAQGNVTPSTTGANSHFDLIEIAGCLEADLTDKMISVNDTFDFAESSLIYPLGTVTANVGNITLSNLYTEAEFGISNKTEYKPGLWAKDNVQSPFRGLADQNARFNLEYVYKIGASEYPVQQFNLFTGAWAINSDDTAVIELRDYSKFFDEQKPLPVYWQGLNAAEIIWRLCDQLGFNNYLIEVDATESMPEIKHWWTDGTKTMWEIIDELSKATQTAIYFDGYGRLRIRSRRHAFNQTASPAWTLRGTNSGAELADIISLEQGDQAQTNHIIVRYYNSDLTPFNRHIPKMERVYEPEGTVALNAAPLRRPITSDMNWITIDPDAVKTWPFKGYAQIQGEIIRYEGKQFTYHRADGTQANAVVTSTEEWKKHNLMGPASKRAGNGFTGRLRIVERGAWNTEAVNHEVEAKGYSVRKIVNGSRTVNSNGFTHRPAESVVRLSSGSGFDNNSDLLIATRGNEADTTFYHYGTRLRFKPTSRTHQRAGLVFNNQGTGESGYYVELQRSGKNDARQEMILYSKKGTNETIIGKTKGATVVDDKWYDLDVRFYNNSGKHTVQVALNGRWVIDEPIPDGEVVGISGKFGMFLRGDSDAEFEYLYAVRNKPTNPLDATTWWDGVLGGYLSQRWDKEWVYTRVGKKKNRKKKRRRSGRFMDEFGPWVHEVREMSVKFDPAPVAHSKLLFTHPGAVVMEYNSSAFGADFTIANASRRTVIVNGDSKTDGNQLCIVVGRTVEVKDAQEITRTNDAQVAISGKIEAELDSPWIQSEDSAVAVADWINEHWSKGADEVTCTIFGNPLIELGDVVSIDYPELYMAPGTHKYFVIGTSNDFNNGIETTLTLRRVT